VEGTAREQVLVAARSDRRSTRLTGHTRAIGRVPELPGGSGALDRLVPLFFE
jgi:hypothetical protein